MKQILKEIKYFHNNKIQTCKIKLFKMKKPKKFLKSLIKLLDRKLFMQRGTGTLMRFNS